MRAAHPPTTDSPTNTILVVLDAADPDPTLQAVIQETDAPATAVDLLAVYSTAEYEERRRARLDAGVPGPYTLDHLAEEARRIAQRVGREYLGPDADEVEAMGAIGATRGCVRRAVRDADYSRVYVADQSHSIWQRLLGIETLSTELARMLPDVVSVVSVDDGVASPADDSDTDVVFDSGPGPTTRSHER